MFLIGFSVLPVLSSSCQSAYQSQLEAQCQKRKPAFIRLQAQTKSPMFQMEEINGIDGIGRLRWTLVLSRCLVNEYMTPLHEARKTAPTLEIIVLCLHFCQFILSRFLQVERTNSETQTGA